MGNFFELSICYGIAISFTLVMKKLELNTSDKIYEFLHFIDNYISKNKLKVKVVLERMTLINTYKYHNCNWDNFSLLNGSISPNDEKVWNPVWNIKTVLQKMQLNEFCTKTANSYFISFITGRKNTC